jgi:hypothetical protein
MDEGLGECVAVQWAVAVEACAGADLLGRRPHRESKQESKIPGLDHELHRGIIEGSLGRVHIEANTTRLFRGESMYRPKAWGRARRRRTTGGVAARAKSDVAGTSGLTGSRRP